jgi:hypothetical protein
VSGTEPNGEREAGQVDKRRPTECDCTHRAEGRHDFVCILAGGPGHDPERRRGL